MAPMWSCIREVNEWILFGGEDLLGLSRDWDGSWQAVRPVRRMCSREGLKGTPKPTILKLAP